MLVVKNNKALSQPKPKAKKPKVKRAKPRTTRARPEPRSDCCSVEYYRSLNDPWQGPSACLPVWPSRPSQRVRAFARGTIDTNPAGYGFIYVNPWTMVTTSTGAANSNALSILANSPSVNTTTWDVATGTNAAYPTGTVGLPHASFTQPTTSTGNFQYRLVSAGIRLRYVGELLSRGGRYVTYRVPGDGNIPYAAVASGVMDMKGLASNREADWGAIEGDWFNVLYSPQERSSLDFIEGNVVPYGSGTISQTPINNLYSPQSSGCLGIFFNTPTPQSIEYEVTANFEIVGREATALVPSLAGSASEPFIAAKLIEDQHNHSSLYSRIARNISQYINTPEVARFATRVGTMYLAETARQRALQRIEL
jgi:hypothetical protein